MNSTAPGPRPLPPPPGAAPLPMLRRALSWRLGAVAGLVVLGLGYSDWREWRQRAVAELPATAALAAQLLHDDLARRVHSFSRAELGVSLAPLEPLGRRAPFCVEVQDIGARMLAAGCLAGDGAGLASGWPARFVQGLATAAGEPVSATLPLTLPSGLKVGTVTVHPHWAGEAPLLWQRWGVLGAAGAALLVLLAAASRRAASRIGERWAAARRQQQQLAEHLLQAREAERRRLARELHDEMGQSLAALQAEAAAMSLMTAQALPAAAASAQAMARTTAQLLEGLQRVLADLRPQALDRFGLAVALQSLVELPRRRPDGSELRVQLTMQAPWPALPPDHDVHVYRIVQEALTNVQRHSRAQHAEVALACDGVALNLIVRDDGGPAGDLPDDERGGEAASSGHGLLGLRERVLALGGQAEWDAPPGGGWRLRVNLPLGPLAAAGGSHHEDHNEAAGRAPGRPKPARIPSGDRPTYPSDEGLT